MFVDGDDILPHRALEKLIGALRASGSDFATGNVLRFGEAGEARQSPMLEAAFKTSAQATHVSRQPTLLADRIIPNKLWRRTFWDAHRFRFPAGVLHEDIGVAIPAHVMATAVDVVAEPCYLYRRRESGDSITQRRLEPRTIRDRHSAVLGTSQFLRGLRRDEAEAAVRRAVRGPGLPLHPAAAGRGRRGVPGAVPGPGQRLLRHRQPRRLRTAARDRPAEVAPGPPPADARAAGGPALREVGRDPPAPTRPPGAQGARRLPVPRRSAAGRPRRRLPGGARADAPRPGGRRLVGGRPAVAVRLRLHPAHRPAERRRRPHPAPAGAGHPRPGARAAGHEGRRDRT